MLIGAALPENHPVRVAAIRRHIQDASSPVPGRQMRGRANLAKMNLSHSEHLAFNLPLASARQAVPVQAGGSLPIQPTPIHFDRGQNQAIDRAVNQFSAHQLAGIDTHFSPRMFGNGGRLDTHVESALGMHIVGLARQYLGTPYLWGGESPKGFDCSGFAQFLYAKIGVNIPRTTYTQWQTGHAVPKRSLQPGDLVFFRGGDAVGGLPGHVGVYIGHGMMIDAPHTGANVRVESVHNFGSYMGARRYSR